MGPYCPLPLWVAEKLGRSLHQHLPRVYPKSSRVPDPQPRPSPQRPSLSLQCSGHVSPLPHSLHPTHWPRLLIPKVLLPASTVPTLGPIPLESPRWPLLHAASSEGPPRSLHLHSRRMKPTSWPRGPARTLSPAPSPSLSGWTTVSKASLSLAPSLPSRFQPCICYTDHPCTTQCGCTALLTYLICLEGKVLENEKWVHHGCPPRAWHTVSAQ